MLPAGKRKPPNFKILDACSWTEKPDRRVEPQGLLYDHFRVAEIRNVGRARRPFRLRRRLVPRPALPRRQGSRNEIQRPSQRQRGGFVAGDKNGHRLISPVVRADAFVLRLQEDGYEIIDVLIGAMLTDDSFEEAVNLRDRFAQAQVVRVGMMWGSVSG